MKEQARRAFGILTNFKEWIFSRYRIILEAGVLATDKADSSAYGQNLSPFEVSQTFTIVRKDARGKDYID